MEFGISCCRSCLEAPSQKDGPMSTAEFQHSDVYRQVEAYSTPGDEPWKADHDRAMACRRCETTIRVGLRLFELIQEIEGCWREHVFRGVEPFRDADERDFLASYRMWLTRTNELIATDISSFEREYDTVEGADQLREFAEEANLKLETWKPPRLSQAVGLRDHQLTEEGAAALDRIIHSTAPLPYVPQQPVPEMSAEEFKRRVRR